ncbi:hypothetical protein CTheo_8189 [Ceratobasidium theobromae]|uniref:Uncharacterized protein n=1 Tax=Ceratobasidium theobromae TaxID=1582974 RepID=A0A5N5Q9R7_9AGAM|nr:hypothetical protein CTheo_8189 [Ceratobasidium theobromae]
MAPARYLAIPSNARVLTSTIPDENKPKSYMTICLFVFSKIAKGIRIPVCALPLHFWLDKTNWALGTVATVIDRDWYMDVATYDLVSRSLKTFQIIVTVPNNPRHSKLKPPPVGTAISVRGLSANLAIHLEIQVTIELENVTFLPRGAGVTPTMAPEQPQPNTLLALGKGKSKRELRLEHLEASSPIKKSKSGPIEAFAPEELRFSSSSGSPGASGSSTKSPSSSDESSR